MSEFQKNNMNADEPPPFPPRSVRKLLPVSVGATCDETALDGKGSMMRKIYEHNHIVKRQL